MFIIEGYLCRQNLACSQVDGHKVVVAFGANAQVVPCARLDQRSLCAVAVWLGTTVAGTAADVVFTRLPGQASTTGAVTSVITAFTVLTRGNTGTNARHTGILGTFTGAAQAPAAIGPALLASARRHADTLVLNTEPVVLFAGTARATTTIIAALSTCTRGHTETLAVQAACAQGAVGTAAAAATVITTHATSAVRYTFTYMVEALILY